MSAAHRNQNQIYSEWETKIQPLIDDVCVSVGVAMGGGAANLFREHSPVDLYTRVYEMTVRHRRDFKDIDFMHGRQIQTIVSFCARFRADGLATLNRHMQGLSLLVRWFGCFFHHLNIFRQRIYGDNCTTADTEMVAAVRTHYLHPQQHAISSWLREAWSVRGLDADALDAVRAIKSVDLAFHTQLVVLYVSCLRNYYTAPSLSLDDTPVGYMGQVVNFFEEEEKLFLTYFQEHDPLDVQTVLREVLVFPHQDRLVGVWAGLVGAGDVAGARVFNRFFSWSSCHDVWVATHKDFATARTRSQHITKLDAFLRSQLRLLQSIFDEDGKWRAVFVRVAEAAVREAFTPAATVQWAREAHRRLSTDRPATMLKLVGYCPDKEDLYNQHHTLLRARLLSGSFDAGHELTVLDAFEKVFGASFALNMRLMLREYQEEEVLGLCGMRRLSRVAWGLDEKSSSRGLKFRPPAAIGSALLSLHARWQEKTNPSVRLGLLPLEGSVATTSGHVMSPIQAIVLLALNGVPIARQGLADKLGVPDDDAHNLTGILRSLEKAGLVVCCGGDQWRHAHTPPPPSLVPVPAPVPVPASSDNGHGQSQSAAAIEAFIVRTLKKRQASGVALAALCRALAPDVPSRRVRELVDGLVQREYLSWHGQDRLVYLP